VDVEVEVEVTVESPEVHATNHKPDSTTVNNTDEPIEVSLDDDVMMGASFVRRE
jgi:hypothetical protein